MKGFWALPAVLRVVVASHATFTVLDDILSYPQYEVSVSNVVLSEAEADAKVAALPSRSPSSAFAPEAAATYDLSQFKPKDDPGSNRDEADHTDESIREYERMHFGDQQYLCSIPYPQLHNDTVPVPSPEEKEKELTRATSEGGELLKGMEGSCIFFNTGWWTYSFCYNHSVKQFHSLPPGKQIPIFPPKEDKSVQSFVLGKFGSAAGKDGSPKGTGQGRKTIDANSADKGGDTSKKATSQNSTETGLARVEQKGELRYMVQELTDGTTCDLTGKPRRIEIQFHCAPGLSSDRIAAIKETSTCAYLMVIQTSRLCSDVAFQPPQKDKPNPIRCVAIIPDGKKLQDFPALASAIEDRERPQEKGEEEPLIDVDYPTYIGDIEFGGNRYLAPPPLTDDEIDDPDREAELKAISKTGWLRDRDTLADSLVLGGHREKHIATVASSTMDTMSQEELKKLNVREREAKELDRFSREMAKMSEGKPWRIDVIETVRGREFRGIIEADEKEKAKQKANAETEKQQQQQQQQQKGDAKEGKKGSQQSDASAEDDTDTEGSEEVYKDEL